MFEGPYLQSIDYKKLQTTELFWIGETVNIQIYYDKTDALYRAKGWANKAMLPHRLIACFISYPKMYKSLYRVLQIRELFTFEWPGVPKNLGQFLGQKTSFKCHIKNLY